MRSYLRRVVALHFVLTLALAGPTAAFEVQEITSENGGIQAWLVEEHSVPLVAIKFAFVGGALQDPKGKEGLADLMADLLMEGAGDLPAERFKERFLRLGTRLSTSNARDATYGALETLTARFEESAELLRVMITSPRFDAEPVEQARAQHQAELAQAATVPAKIAVARWYAEAFPAHVYGRPVSGTTESVARISVADLKQQHARLFAKDVLRIVIVGDIDKPSAAKAVDTIFGGLPEKAQITSITKVEPRPVAEPVVVTMDKASATAAFGLPSLSTNDPAFPALQVLNHVIGSGDFDSRLMDEVRVKKGLAYSIQTRLISDPVSSVMLGDVTTKNENMGAALGAVKEVLATIAREGIPEAQFDIAKKYLTGSLLLDFDSSAKMVNSLLGIWMQGKGPEYLRTRNKTLSNLKRDDIRRVAGQILKADRLIVTVVGKPKLD